MRHRLRSSILVLWAGALWLQLPGAWGERIPVHEPTNRVPANRNTKLRGAESSSPDEMMVEEDEAAAFTNTEQVTINRTDTNPSNPPSEPPVPISAVLFDSSPGPKDCRGNVILTINLPKPGAQHSRPTCYNVPGVAQCGNFLATKNDGCQARVFNEPNCLTFANLAVFIPEKRAFGGYVRSLEITCGVVSVVPPPLNLPGLELPSNAQQAVG